ncbi:hypothetical protein NVP1178O_17 [Vibrio phage 1.178.O._10N.286.45.E12]|nr:hypothetical protein NVP1178O_17 [Vibrio phage 1.178.O._10N.286.45.E12]
MMDKKKVRVDIGLSICPTEVNAMLARILNPNKQPRRNKSCRKRNRKNRWN